MPVFGRFLWDNRTEISRQLLTAALIGSASLIWYATRGLYAERISMLARLELVEEHVIRGDVAIARLETDEHLLRRAMLYQYMIYTNLQHALKRLKLDPMPEMDTPMDLLVPSHQKQKWTPPELRLTEPFLAVAEPWRAEAPGNVWYSTAGSITTCYPPGFGCGLK